jgi:hypothetical protein
MPREIAMENGAVQCFDRLKLRVSSQLPVQALENILGRLNATCCHFYEKALERHPKTLVETYEIARMQL